MKAARRRRKATPMGRLLWLAAAALSCQAVGCSDEPRLLVQVVGVPAAAAWLDTSIKLDGRAVYQMPRLPLGSFAGQDAVTFGLRLPAGYGGHVMAVITAGDDGSGCITAGGAADADIRGDYSNMSTALRALPTPACDATQPLIVSVSPVKSRSTGGATAVIRGLRFQPGADVHFDDTRSDSVEIRSELELAATVPARPGALGKVPLSVTNSNRTTASRSDLFSYYAGTIQFTPITTNPIAEPNSILGLTLGRMDSDNFPDLVASTNGNVLIYKSQGSSFTNTRQDTGIAGGNEVAAVTDMNRDGYSDIVLPAQGKIYLNQPASPGMFLAGPGPAPGSTHVHGLVQDLDGDGFPDIAALDRVPSSSTCPTTLQNPYPMTVPRGNLCAFTAINQLDNASPSFATAGGFQYDSQELLTANLKETVRTLDKGFVKVGHINDDALPDLVTLSVYSFNSAISYGTGAVQIPKESSIQILLNRGSGQLASEYSGRYGAPADFLTYQPADSILLADLNGDGKDEIAVLNQRLYQILILDNDGKGSFAPRPQPMSISACSSASVLRASDVDGDGSLDLVVGCGDTSTVGRVEIFPNEGDGSFLPFRKYEFIPESGVTTLLAAPMFGSQRPDLAVGQASGKILFYRNSSQ